MSLIPEEKQRIRDEERYKMHEDEYRAEVRRELRTPDPPRPPIVRAVIVAFLTFVIVAALMGRINGVPTPVGLFIGLVAALVVAKKVR